MRTIKNIILSLYFVSAICFALSATAQDTTKRKTINITSTFKPVLRDAAKINFNAAPPVADTTKPSLNYSIPTQNLVFTFQPSELKPVALDVDSITAWDYSNFIKFGVGNVHFPFVQAGFSFGDRKNTFFNIFANHYTSKGKLPFQKNSLTNVAAAATYKTPRNLEWNGSMGFSNDDYFLYGYRADSLNFTKDDLKQGFQTIEGKVHLRNIVPTEFGLTYNPSISVSVFRDNHKPVASESNTVLRLPLQKTFPKSFGFNLSLTADLTNYRNEENGKARVQNNLYLISPAVLIKTPNLFLNAGLIPSWDNKVFKMLPNIMADISTDDQRFTILLGWIGYYNKGSYQRFAAINPWLAQPDSLLLNSIVEEGYGGFKGSVGNHFSYSAKAGFQWHRNIALFVNDPDDGKTFLIRYSPSLKQLQVHAEGEYSRGEQFSAKAMLNWNQFNKIKGEAKPWGIIPVELKSSLRWQLFKDFWFKSEVWVFGGPYFLSKTGNATKGGAGVDLNAGAEFRVMKNLNLWLQMNNILNNKYERWNQYQVFGFNILGGIVYSFNQK